MLNQLLSLLLVFSFTFASISADKSKTTYCFPSCPTYNAAEIAQVQAKENHMEITSDAFENNKPIPAKYTCDGENINPALTFVNVPEGCKSLALIMEDPDVPKSIRADGMWDHWLAWNIPPSATSIAENTTPSRFMGRNTSGTLRYASPCPPDREHRYFFKLYALDTMLDLKPGATKKELLKAMEGHILEEAQLIGLYNRTKK